MHYPLLPPVQSHSDATAADITSFPKLIITILHQNVSCGYSVELPHWGNSNEYPQDMFWCKNNETMKSYPKKNTKTILLSRAMINYPAKVITSSS